MALPALTPVGMAILSLLSREPMHPYEMRHRVRVQEIDRVMKVTQGTLYGTVERLAAGGLIEPLETSRDGRRPERTVYAITELGRDQMLDALRDALMRTAPEYRRLAVALSFAGMLDSAEVADLLDRRAVEVEAQLSGLNTAIDATLKQSRLGLARVHVIETEYLAALVRAELDWLRGTVEDIRSGRLTWDGIATGHTEPPETRIDPGAAAPGPVGEGDGHA